MILLKLIGLITLLHIQDCCLSSVDGSVSVSIVGFSVYKFYDCLIHLAFDLNGTRNRDNLIKEKTLPGIEEVSCPFKKKKKKKF